MQRVFESIGRTWAAGKLLVLTELLVRNSLHRVFAALDPQYTKERLQLLHKPFPSIAQCSGGNGIGQSTGGKVMAGV